MTRKALSRAIGTRQATALGELLRRGIEIAEVYLIHTAGSKLPPDDAIAGKKHITFLPIEIPHPDILTEEGAKAAESTIFIDKGTTVKIQLPLQPTDGTSRESGVINSYYCQEGGTYGS